MKLTKTACTFIAASLLSIAGSANATLIETSGVWSNALLTNGGSAAYSDSDSTISWGTTTHQYPTQSGYNFTGSSLDVDTSGEAFVLGTFTHFNFPIYQPTLVSADLDVSVNIAGTTFSDTFSFDFDHNETPNNGGTNKYCEASNTFASAAPCPDVVTMSMLNAFQDITIDSTEYLLNIFGFKNDATGEFTQQFITAEGESNSTFIYARLIESPVAVPEPGSMGLLALGLIALGFSRRRIS